LKTPLKTNGQFYNHGEKTVTRVTGISPHRGTTSPQKDINYSLPAISITAIKEMNDHRENPTKRVEDDTYETN